MKHVKKIVCSVTAIIAVVVGQPYSSNLVEPVGEVVISGTRIGILHISPKALELIGNAEACRRTPYTCPAGLPTDGIGNTRNVTGKEKTDEQIAADWTGNIIRAQNCLIIHSDFDRMSQGQKDAFTSFVFNTGCTRFRLNKNGSETRIFKKIKAKQYTAACNELPFWVYGGGKKLSGLVKRRAKERALCLAADS